ncbi:serine/threonine-protein kinase PknK [Mycobacterium kiyosense]|uniref:Serine/threonine-protein kinase PknK n=1 Tax=Mycobacterium kiyosense TaxID=2871094 RepID=A0AA37PWG6_9MYCO|nr:MULTISPECIES: serine/threonine-protein kinase [Mycobacterium]GLB85110.1 serine/threonine-protein kinase PknK [Mycobacterium kiyosense]GLB97585.1 serine/threonine-protein kinase PknK [Mycobacterium kiyosense]GLD40609.1 serine/threonine-protein kinase PknK [Mycobacterium kiyosense]
MANPDDTQRRLATGVVAELEAEGYHDAEPVGRGGFGVVYRCKEPSLERLVAIKVLSSDSDDLDLERFALEQRAMGRVSGHPNIVPVLHSGLTFAGRPYIVMPYHSRNTLDSWIKGHGPLAVDEALAVGVRLAGAVETAHRAGVLHRDIKPSNVLLSTYGEPQLSDFGIARITGAGETVANMLVGSPSYVAPELFEGHVASIAADVYSLAATVFAFISGEPPFPFRPGENIIAFARRVMAGPIPDLRTKGVPDPICLALELGLNTDPACRPGSAAAFGEALRAAGGHVGLNIAELPLELPAPPPDAEGSSRHSSVSGPIGNSVPLGLRSDRSGPARRANYPPSAPTRFRPPTFNRPAVRRRRILDQLGAGRRPKLVLIHAPAGYGKSTLAAQWAEALTGQGLKTAWLAVDTDDNNTVWFIAHLIEAIRRAMPDLADTLQQEFEGRLENAQQYVLNALIDWLHSDKQTLALVIEDWHRVDTPETTDALAYLLENCCHHLHLIVTSRSGAGLPLSTLRVQGELIDIDATLLKFDKAESRALLVDQCGLDISAADVAELEESTDGWAAALQLASLSLRDHADPAALIEHLSGRDKAIGEYLASNVLGSLEPELLDFLLATCVTKQICGGLAAALTGDQRSRSILEDIEKRDLFLRRIDAEGSWFQYHHLFAEYLLHRLEHDAHDRIPELHRKAAHWFSEHQMLSQAVDHLLLAGDAAQAVDIVEQAAQGLNEQSQMSMLIGLAAKLPVQHLDACPRLQVDLAWANVVLHRLKAAEDALRLADIGTDSVATADQAEDLRAEMDLIRAVVADFEDRMDAPAAAAAVAACVDRAETLRPWVLCRAADVASSRAIQVFDFDDALRWQRWGRQYHRQISGALSASYGYCFAAIAANEQLDVAGAEAHLRHARRIAQLPSGRPTYVAKLAGSLLGELLYERGQLEEAEALLDNAYELGAEGGLVVFMFAAFGTGARLKFAGGDTVAADRRLAEGLDIARQLRLPRLEARLVNEQVRLAALSSGAVDESLARRVLGEGPQDLDGIGNTTAEFKEDAQIRLLLVQGQSSTIDAACNRAGARRDRLDQRKRPRAHLQATLQYALCLAVAGNSGEAQRVLAPALRICAALGLSRLLIDEGSPMLRLAADTVAADEFTAADPTTAANVREFVLSLAAASTV